MNRFATRNLDFDIRNAGFFHGEADCSQGFFGDPGTIADKRKAHTRRSASTRMTIAESPASVRTLLWNCCSGAR